MKRIWSVFGLCVLLFLWEAASLALKSNLLLPGPLLVAQKFALLVPSPVFLHALGASFLRVMAGLAFSAPLGVAVGFLMGLSRRADYFFRPFLSLIAATPVMALILIFFLILGSELTPVLTAFLIIFPVMANNTSSAIRALDSDLKEVCRIYRIGLADRMHALYLPSIVPGLLSGLRTSLSLGWKVVVAAEVLVQPLRALGTGMQQAKAEIETPELFAWTAATVLAAALSEAVLRIIETKVLPHVEH
jgi:NitT/TauT family transport system permease protein